MELLGKKSPIKVFGYRTSTTKQIYSHTKNDLIYCVTICFCHTQPSIDMGKDLVKKGDGIGCKTTQACWNASNHAESIH